MKIVLNRTDEVMMNFRFFVFLNLILILSASFSSQSAWANLICRHLFEFNVQQQKMQLAKTEMKKAILGQDEAVDIALATFLIHGHVLLEGPPGTGKTRFALTLARIFGGKFSRIQFTNDLMPSNILGGKVRDRESREEKFVPGPIFTDFLLADEINRGPSKSQSAFLEPMSGGKVIVDGVEHQLPKNFFAIATQNPNDQVGTNPLPEAQYDRFTARINIDHPTGELRERIATMAMEERMGISSLNTKVKQVLSLDDLPTIQSEIMNVQLPADVRAYAVRLFDAIQDPQKFGMSDMAGLRKEGISARGLTDLLLISKAGAWMDGRDTVNLADLKRYIVPVLAHRLVLGPVAKSEGQTQHDVLNQFIKNMNRSASDASGRR